MWLTPAERKMEDNQFYMSPEYMAIKRERR